MCGIFGVVGTSLSDSAIEGVCRVLGHRGPDGHGSLTDPATRVTLAHTRLAVIDLATGAQPIESDDGNLILVCNGEIYDFERIRSTLEARGHRFRTKSDSEVIIYLYKEYGLDCFAQLRGEFAFLLYDKAKRLLVAGRDRFGIKPLYFTRLDQGFVFASEMKALFASGLVAAKLNASGLDPLLDVDPDNPQYPFEGISSVPPASYLLVDLDTLQSRTVRYWSSEIPASAAEPLTEPEPERSVACAQSVLEHLEEAVRLRLRADVPVGLYLSGGIDSAFVGALMTRNVRSRVHSFSISFLGSDRNEQEYTRRSAQFLDTAHHELALTKAMLWDNLEGCVRSTELPFATLAPVGKYLLSAEARKFVTVVLNGQGADELFLGYRAFFQKAIRDTRNPRSRGPTRSIRLRRLMLPDGLLNLSLLLFHKSHRRRIALARASALARSDASKPLVNAIQEGRIAEMPVDILGYLGDRVEMAHSLEVRVPFLDHHLYDAARSIPVDFKLRGGVEKAVLRDAAKGILPDDIRVRRKLGFMVTSDSIDFFGADREMTNGLRAAHFSREAFERAGIFSYGAYRLLRVLARLPDWKRLRALGQLRRNANKVLMHILQAHMLHHMFIAEPRLPTSRSQPTVDESTTEPLSEAVA